MDQVTNYFSNASAGFEQPKRGRPKSNFREIHKSSQEGCKANETRATFIVKEDALEKIKALAYWQRLKVKDVVQAALAEHLGRYEQANGPIQLHLNKPRRLRWSLLLGNLKPGEFLDFPCESQQIKRTTGARSYGKARGWRMYIFPLDEKTVRIVRVK